MMLYLKNVPRWERVLRILLSAGASLMAYNAGMGIVVTALIASFSLTGFVGFCPVCAMVGRKLKEERIRKE